MKKCASLLLLTVLLARVAGAETPEEKGLAIANEVDRRNQGYADMVVAMTMTLIDARGKTDERKLDLKALEVTAADDGDKALLVFNQPRDVAGTALLTATHIQAEDDQWLYLPALKRIKRISSSNKTGSFMGSEFSYEDLAPQEVRKYQYKFLRHEPCGALRCLVVEVYPGYKNSGYAKLINWIDDQEYRSQKIAFYDTANQLLKTLTAEGYRQYLNQYWRPDTLMMVNHKNGKGTRLTFGEYRFKTGLKDNDFAPAALQRGR
ncbi:MAG: outer membrane lipoprotein-sorting protein [Pseudomonadota bacterium]